MTVDYLTTRQFAERLQVPASIVRHLLASGKLSGTKVNNRWRVPAAALREYIEAAPLRRRRTKELTADDPRPCYQVPLARIRRQCSRCGKVTDPVHIPTSQIGYFCRQCCPACNSGAG
jgi:excisionase family DNA binding protein